MESRGLKNITGAIGKIGVSLFFSSTYGVNCKCQPVREALTCLKWILPNYHSQNNMERDKKRSINKRLESDTPIGQYAQTDETLGKSAYRRLRWGRERGGKI